MIENKIVIKDRIVQLEKATLGISGENEQETLVFLFEDGFVDGTCYLELEFLNRQKYSIELEKKDESYRLEVKNSLLRFAGPIDMQLKIVKRTAVWKSTKFKMIVDEAINAVESMEEDYPCFVERIDIRTQELETAVKQIGQKVDDVEKKEETDPTVARHIKDITQNDIENWNHKSDFSGDYNDLENKPQIPSTNGLASEEFVEDKISLIDEKIGSLATALDEINGMEV